jgi:hypothetical protein
LISKKPTYLIKPIVFIKEILINSSNAFNPPPAKSIRDINHCQTLRGNLEGGGKKFS